jgi:glycosyltransferase involved in cell wall biosynthesis
MAQVSDTNGREIRPAEGQFRVLLVGHTYVLRINQQKLVALARRCAAAGVLVPSNWRDREGLFDGQLLPPERGLGSFAVLEVPVSRAGHAASYWFEPVAMGRTLAGFKPDIVHIDQEVYSLAAAQVTVAAKAAGRKVVVFGWENLDRRIHPVQRAARKTVLGLADAIVCGNSEGAELVRKRGFHRRIEVIPQMGVDPSLFRKPERRSEGPFTIGYVGRLVEPKAVDVLLRGLAALASRGLDFRACICGVGPSDGELRGLARALGVDDKVRWTGLVTPEGVPDLMRGLHALVLPSRSVPTWKEQFGHVLIEAMATGVPVVGSCSGAIPEVIGRPDLVFAEEDAAGLAQILERLMTDEVWRGEVEAYGISRVKQWYTHDRIAERLTELWAKILNPDRC